MPYLTMPPLPSAHNTSHKPDRREMFTGCGFRVVRDAGIFGVGFQIEVFDSSPHKQARNQMQGDASTGGGLVAPNHATGSVAARTQEVHRWPVIGAHMAKLSKQEAKNHEEAECILTKPKLTDDDRQFVIEHWQESATHINGLAGAFFTPYGLATDAMIELGGWGFDGSVLDLCAGMGTLSLAAKEMSRVSRIVCVELNPAYAEVGRKMVPDAEWITGSVFDHADWGMFDHAISNPPFGKIKRDGNAPRYKNGEFEYHVIDIAAHHATYGTFIIPGMSAGFTLSNDYGYRRSDHQKYTAFEKQTGITLDAGCGVDTRVYADEWHGVSPQVEIACAEFPPADDVALF